MEVSTFINLKMLIERRISIQDRFAGIHNAKRLSYGFQYIFIEILLFAILTYEIRAFIQNAYRATDIGQIALYFIVNLAALGMAWYRYVDAKAET